MASSLAFAVLAAVMIQCCWHIVEAGKCKEFEKCGHTLDCEDNYVCAGALDDAALCYCQTKANYDKQTASLKICQDHTKSPPECVTRGTCAEGDECGWPRDCAANLYCRKKDTLTGQDKFPGKCARVVQSKTPHPQAVTDNDFKTIGKEAAKGANVDLCHKSTKSWYSSFIKLL